VGRAASAVLLIAAVLVAVLGPVAKAEPAPRWRYLLDRAAQAAEERAYAGEALWVTYDAGQAHVSTFQVQSSGNGDLSLADSDNYAIRLADDGGGLAEYERGWFVPLPAADLAKAHKGLSRLEEKYQVAVTGSQQLLDRDCTTLEITARAGGGLVERLWIDDASGLLLRRETYAGDELLRMVSYLALDLNPRRTPRGAPTAQRATRGQRPSMVRRSQEVAEVDSADLEVLRDAGWTVPTALPGNYRAESSFAVSAGDSQPLQVVYSDGLYTMSLFEQSGRPNWDTLPPGAQETTDLGFKAYTWPGAVPQRMVWEASGVTYSLVGDAPPEEFRAVVAALPHPTSDGLVDRLQRGLGRLWSWVSPWS
jgi:hypothetical protein